MQNIIIFFVALKFLQSTVEDLMNLRGREEQTDRGTLTDRRKRGRASEEMNSSPMNAVHSQNVHCFFTKQNKIYEITKKCSMCTALCKKQQQKLHLLFCVCEQHIHNCNRDLQQSAPKKANIKECRRLLHTFQNCSTQQRNVLLNVVFFSAIVDLIATCCSKTAIACIFLHKFDLCRRLTIKKVISLCRRAYMCCSCTVNELTRCKH